MLIYATLNGKTRISVPHVIEPLIFQYSSIILTIGEVGNVVKTLLRVFQELLWSHAFITKYGSTLYIGMDEVLAHYACTF